MAIKGVTLVRRGLALVVLAALSLLPTMLRADAQEPLKFEAVTEPFEAVVEEASFPTFDAQGQRIGRTRWRVVNGTGNDRENYLASTEEGMLLDFGGEWLRFSEDEGRTWHSVLPPEEFREWWSYEGAVAVAPGGDVVAAGQDALVSGIFRAMTFKYEAAAGQWFYSFAESSAPFLDRPAIGVLPGPFQIGGTTVPYVAALRGGLLLTKSYWAYSFDGLNYSVPNSRFIDALTSLPESAPLQVERWGELDWIQSHELVGIAPLGRGRALAERPSIGAFDSESHAPRTVLDPATLRWRPYEFGESGPPQTSVANCVEGTNYSPCMTSEGRTLADARGNLHHVAFGEAGITYWFSRDGGATWTKSVTPLMDGYTAPSNGNLNRSFKVSGRHRIAAVVVHALKSEDPLVTQDLVYVFSFEHGPPRVERIHALGNADFSCLVGGVGLGGGTQPDGICDFPSITFVDGGRIAVSFTDAAHPEPAVAIQLAGRH